jgi:hypothetical protein
VEERIKKNSMLNSRTSDLPAQAQQHRGPVGSTLHNRMGGNDCELLGSEQQLFRED